MISILVQKNITNSFFDIISCSSRYYYKRNETAYY